MISIHLKKIDQMLFGAAIEGDKVFAINFGINKKHMLKSLLANIPFGMQFQVAEKQDMISENFLVILKAIYDGKGVSPNFSLDMEHLSKYSHKVLKCIRQIPVGYLTSYGAVAKTCGGSPRAVGRVMATNPFPLLIPCHRVVQADFSIGGYGGNSTPGKKVKLEILQREDRGYIKPKEIMTESGVLLVHPASEVLKRAEQEDD